MDLLNTNANNFITFLLVLVRVSGVFFLAPVLGSRNIPPQLKIGLSLIIAIILTPFVEPLGANTSMSLIELVLLIAKEVTVGAIIGFTATLIFTSFLLAGQIIDFQMGFGMVNVIDPLSNISISIMGQFKNLLAVLVFLAINGHHFFFSALSKSFEIVPLAAFSLSSQISNDFISVITNIFIIGLKIGAPAIGILFITELATGIIARTVPQMNVFVVGIPLKIMIGFLTVITMLSFFFAYLLRIFDQMPAQLLDAIK